MKTIIAILALCTMTAHARIMEGGYWPAPRSSGTNAPALSWWQDTNQVNIGFWSWQTNTTPRWLQDAGNYSATGAPSASRQRVDLGGGAIALRSTNSTLFYIVGTTNIVNGSTAVTYGAWVYLNSLVANAGVMVSRGGGGPSGLSANNGSLIGNVSTNTANTVGTVLTSPGTIVTGSWVSLVCTMQKYSGSNVQTLYTNGIACTNTSRPEQFIQQANSPFRIGYEDSEVIRVINGYIDWAFILTNRALTASEISGWHGATYPPTTVP